MRTNAHLWLATVKLSGLLSALFLVAVAGAISGCGRAQDDAALDSDVNGFVCLSCMAKFYTDRQVFANHCPSCQKPNVELVMGFLCPADQHVSYAPRGRGSLACEKCGKVTGSLSIPREVELKAWGAVHKTGPEVGVN